jgi:hypothetical protein
MKGTRIKPPALTGRFASGNHFGSIFRSEKGIQVKKRVWDIGLLDS